jgi:hypothetical protein
MSLIEDKNHHESMSVDDVIEKLQDRGFGILMFLFSFPMAIPLPYPPGFTTILGLPLLFFSLQMLLGMERVWVPKWIGGKELKVKHIAIAIKSTSAIFRKFEKFIKPRLPFLTSQKGERLIGFVALLCSISIALPIMFGNAVPSAGIMIMSIGLIYLDGVMIIIGIIISFFGLFIASLVLLLGIKAFKYLVTNMMLYIVGN